MIDQNAIAQFEQMGIAREVLVNVVLGEFHRRWDLRFAELEQRYAPKQVPEWEYIALARLRDSEQERALRESLGDERFLAWDKEETLRIMNAGSTALTVAESERAYELQKEFEQRRAELQRSMENGDADMADVRRLQEQAQAVLQEELVRLLGEKRYHEMRGVVDPIEVVYHQYGNLDPTPDQAEAVVRVEDEYRAREAALRMRLQESADDDARTAVELIAISEARDNDLRQIFGSEAYDEMKRQTDPFFQKLIQFSEAWELRDEEVFSVYETLRDLAGHADRARAAAGLRQSAGHPVDWRAVEVDVELARQQAERTLLSLIGDQRLLRLKQNDMLTR